MSNRTVHIIPANIASLLFQGCEAGRPKTANWNITMANGDVFMINEAKYNELLSLLDASLDHFPTHLQGNIRLYAPVRII